MISEQNLKAIVFTALHIAGANIKPYCIRTHAYDALYLPDDNTIISIDLTDVKGRRDPNNPILQNNNAKKDNLKVFRIRTLLCTNYDMESFNYYIDDFSDNTVLSLLQYLAKEFLLNSLQIKLPNEVEAYTIFRCETEKYDAYYRNLCCDYADKTGHTSLTLSEKNKNEYIGVWIDFKGTGFTIKNNGKSICSRKTSYGDDMEKAHTKGRRIANMKIEKQWLDNYSQLKAFYEKHGHMVIPTENGSLQRWLKRQRTAYRQGKLSHERTKLLEELNIIWEPDDLAEQRWDEHLSLLVQYEKEYGTIDVPQNCIYHKKALGKWVAKQRLLKRKNKLLSERISKLSKIGFVWHSPKSKMQIKE